MGSLHIKQLLFGNKRFFFFSFKDAPQVSKLFTKSFDVDGTGDGERLFKKFCFRRFLLSKKKIN